MQKLYMAVTADRLELPLCVEAYASDLADFLEVKENTVYAYIYRAYKGSKINTKLGNVKIVKVVVD